MVWQKVRKLPGVGMVTAIKAHDVPPILSAFGDIAEAVEIDACAAGDGD